MNIMLDILFMLDSILPAIINEEWTDNPPAFIENVKQVTAIYTTDFSIALSEKILPILFKIFE